MLSQKRKTFDILSKPLQHSRGTEDEYNSSSRKSGRHCFLDRELPSDCNSSNSLYQVSLLGLVEA